MTSGAAIAVSSALPLPVAIQPTTAATTAGGTVVAQAFSDWLAMLFPGSMQASLSGKPAIPLPSEEHVLLEWAEGYPPSLDRDLASSAELAVLFAEMAVMLQPGVQPADLKLIQVANSAGPGPPVPLGEPPGMAEQRAGPPLEWIMQEQPNTETAESKVDAVSMETGEPETENRASESPPSPQPFLAQRPIAHLEESVPSSGTPLAAPLETPLLVPWKGEDAHTADLAVAEDRATDLSERAREAGSLAKATEPVPIRTGQPSENGWAGVTRSENGRDGSVQQGASQERGAEQRSNSRSETADRPRLPDPPAEMSGSSRVFHAQLETVASETHEKGPGERIQVVEQLLGKLEAARLGHGRHEVTVRLEPAHLGSVTVTVATDKDVVVARFIAENSIALKILEADQDRLKSALAERGMTLGQLDVALGGHGGGERLAERQMPSPTVLLRRQERVAEDSLQETEWLVRAVPVTRDRRLDLAA